MTSIHYSQSRVLVGVGVGLAVSLTYLYYKYTKKDILPTKWKKVGKLEQVYYYPVKSCAPIELDEAVCENLGVCEGDIKDRALMLVEDNGQKITARTYPKMFQIVPKVIGPSKLLISAPGMEDIEFDYAIVCKDSSRETKAIIYEATLTTIDCGEKYHKWFSTFLTGKPKGLRLVYYSNPNPTKGVDRDHKKSACTNQDTGGLHDVTSYMMINNDSVEELNSRLKNKIPALQFRGNFFIKTDGTPFVEDQWEYIRIGDEAVFRIFGPCYRCIMPNINPFSSKRDPDGEPLKTLKKYRVIATAPTKSPAMGVQMGLRVPGKVKRGDALYIADFTK